MLATHSVSLSTALPGCQRRRVWQPPEVLSHSLVVLTESTLHLAPAGGNPPVETVQSIEGGKPLDDLLPPLSATIELIAVLRLKHELLDNTIRIHYLSGAGSAQTAVRFTKAEAADKLFSKLFARLGPAGYEVQPYKPAFWAAAWLPLLVMAGILVVFGGSALVLGVLEETRAAKVVSVGGNVVTPQTPGEILADWAADGPGWRTVCAVGGVLAALVQVWFYRRVTRPPTALEVVKKT
jgi:hypothetical protein